MTLLVNWNILIGSVFVSTYSMVFMLWYMNAYFIPRNSANRYVAVLKDNEPYHELAS